jgi:hypothetical protein
MDTLTIYYYTIILLSIGLFIKSLEYIVVIKLFSKGSIFDYSVIGIDLFQLSKLGSFFKVIYSKKGVLLLSLISILTVLAVFFTRFQSILFYIALGILLLVNLILYYRHSYGLDGADQMSLLIIITILLCFLINQNDLVGKIGLFFIALQLSISYIVSGIAKLFSEKWRSGTAIQGILSTYTYGTAFTRNWLTKNKSLCKIICWTTILMETLFPISLFFGSDITLIFLGFGFLFHLSIAIVMGLNDFVWSFCAAYPAYYYLSTLI